MIDFTQRWSDFSALIKIEKEAAQKFLEVGYDSTHWPVTTEEEFARLEELDCLWVAHDDKYPVGFALMEFFGSWVHIHEMDVHPSWMQQGIGGALLQHVVQTCLERGAEGISLRTFLTTPWSRRLYLQSGFALEKEPPSHISCLIDQEKRAGLPTKDRVTFVYHPPKKPNK